MGALKKYQIFISSTFEDLKEARSKVMQSILKMGHIPVGMEMFATDGRDQWNTIKKSIDECDYYIIIIGHRYGSLSKTGISYTEKEFNYAKKNNIPVLIFLRSDNVRLLPEEMENDSDKKKKLSELKKRIREKYLFNLWETPDNLALNVTTALSKIFNEQPRLGWVRPCECENKTKEYEALIDENKRLKAKLSNADKLLYKRPNLKITLDNCKFIFRNQPIGLLEYGRDCQKLKIDIVPEYLRSYVTSQEIDEYNDNLPSKEDVDDYNYNLRIVSAASDSNYGRFPLCIENMGTLPATNVKIRFDVPDGVIVVRKWTMEHTKECETILPINPIKKAENQYKRAMVKSSNGIVGGRLTARVNPFFGDLPKYMDEIDPQVLYKERNVKVWDDGGEINIQINRMQQEEYIDFGEELVLIPMEKGEFNFRVSIICDEYAKSEYVDLVISVRDSYEDVE